MTAIRQRLQQRLLQELWAHPHGGFDRADLWNLVSAALGSDWRGGKAIDDFVSEFTTYLGCSYGVAVNSGTSALALSLEALDVGHGDEVIVPSYTFYSTAGVVPRVKATPVFVDVNLEDGCIDPREVVRATRQATKAVIPVHLAGLPAALSTLSAFAAEKKIAVIEDAAQAVGTRSEGRAVGTVGAFGCFSFQAYKTMTSGQGGFLATNDRTLYETAYALSHAGRRPSDPESVHTLAGGNFRMTLFQATLLRAQLPKLEAQIAKRRRGFEKLHSTLRGVSGVHLMQTSTPLSDISPSAFAFVVEPGRRDAVLTGLRRFGLPCHGGYDRPLYEQPVFSRPGAAVVYCRKCGRHEDTPCPDAHPNARRLASGLVVLDHVVLSSSSVVLEGVARVLKHVLSR